MSGAELLRLAARILAHAKVLISLPERWTQREEARDAGGDPVNVASPAAVCWCSLGATRRARRDLDPIATGSSAYVAAETLADDALCRAAKKRGGFGVASYQDSHEHADALGMFDDAIADIAVQIAVLGSETSGACGS